MVDDLIPTAEVAQLLGVNISSLNRWAAESREDRPQPALTLPGRTGARLYRRSDVDAYRASHGMCLNCPRPTWHPNGETCPELEAAS